MKSEIVPFREEHLQGFEPRIDQPGFGDWLRERAGEAHAAMGTIYRKPDVLGFIGYHVRNQNTAEVWVLLNQKNLGNALTLIRLVKRAMGELMACGFGRLQAMANANCEPAWRFLEALGFEREGLLRGYGPNGEDRFMYGRVKEWQHL